MSTDPTTDRRRHDGLSRVSRSKILRILKIGYWNRLSELRDEVAGRAVTGMTGRHRLFSKFQSLNSVTEAAGRTVAVTTARHRLRNPRLSRISLNVLRDVLDYSCFNYKVSGLILISLITWGLKEVTLS